MTCPDRIRDALRFIPADNRDDWLRTAMAIKAELGNEGFFIWDEWSQSANNYKAKDALTVWKSIRVVGGVTIATLYHLARSHGWIPGAGNTSSPWRAPRPPPHVDEARQDWSDRAEAIWQKTQPLRGSLGEIYLRHRGCVIPPPDSDVRFLPGNDRHPPSLCALITDIQTALPISLHFTRLAADGRGKASVDRIKVLLAGHRKGGGVIRVWPDEAVTLGLALGEGIETVCAIAHVCTPVWAAIDAGNLANFPVLPGIEAITIYADNDEVGLRAAGQCARRWHRAGRQIRVLKARTRGQDAADIAGDAA